jgi:hypothetical protein
MVYKTYNMKKEIISKNSKGQYHGYQELYGGATDKVYYRTMYKNDIQYGYTEYHANNLIDNNLYSKTRFYII